MGKPKNFQFSQFDPNFRGSIEDDSVCPYNPRHVLPYKRLQLHIIKCQKRHPTLSANFVTCPYSSLHRFPKDQQELHVKSCDQHTISLHSRSVTEKSGYVAPNNQEKEEKGTKPEFEVDFDPQTLAEWEAML